MISIKDLHGIKVHRAVNNREMYKNVYNKCKDKIILSALRGHNSTNFFIRPIDLDRPLINTKNAFNYIRDKLTKGNFKVMHVTDGFTYMLVISWDLDRTDLVKSLADQCVHNESTIS